MAPDPIQQAALLHQSRPRFVNTPAATAGMHPSALFSPRPRRPQSAGGKRRMQVAMDARTKALADHRASRELSRMLGGMTLAAPAPVATAATAAPAPTHVDVVWTLDVMVATVDLKVTMSDIDVHHIEVVSIKAKGASWESFVPRVHRVVMETLKRWRPSSLRGLCTIAQAATMRQWLQSEATTSLKSGMVPITRQQSSSMCLDTDATMM